MYSTFLLTIRGASLSSQDADRYIIFGCRSPLVVDYEESIVRAGLSLLRSVSLNGTPRVLDQSKVMSLEQFSSGGLKVDTARFIACAFASERRRELVEVAEVMGLKPAKALLDPTAILPSSLRVGRGAYINAGAVIGGASFIGSHTLINRSSSIGHHCFIGDYVSIAPGVTLASNVRVGDGVTIGAGAVVVPNIVIGEGAVIGAGSLIRKDIDAWSFWAGNPAICRELDRTKSALNTSGEE